MAGVISFIPSDSTPTSQLPMMARAIAPAPVPEPCSFFKQIFDGHIFLPAGTKTDMDRKLRFHLCLPITDVRFNMTFAETRFGLSYALPCQGIVGLLRVKLTVEKEASQKQVLPTGPEAQTRMTRNDCVWFATRS